MSASRWAKLAAIANDAAATENERRVAHQLMAALPERARGAAVLLHAREVWEIALLYAVVGAEPEATLTQIPDGYVVSGPDGAVTAVIETFLAMNAQLEEVILAATGGFLAARFPAPPSADTTPPGPMDDVLSAAYSASALTRPKALIPDGSPTVQK